MSGITQSLLDLYEREATHNDPHSPWYDGPDEDAKHSNQLCGDSCAYGEGCMVQNCNCTCHEEDEEDAS